MSNILSLLIERIEYDQYERLIEEGRDPSELLHYKFQHIPSEVIDKVISIDPTKKKSYSQWLLSKWKEERPIILNGLQDGSIEKLFQHYKNHNDLQIKDCPSVEVGLRKFVPKEDNVLVKSSKPLTTLMNRGWEEEVDSDLANDFDIVFNDDNWIIAVPNTYEAECKLGENMNWCTAGGRSNFEGGRSYYNRYLQESGGKYYVNFDMSRGESRLGKDYPFTRYQFHFETKQFMDKEDEPVSLDEIKMPNSAIEFYEENGYDMDDLENLEVKMERYEQQRGEYTRWLNDDLYLCFDFDQNLEFTEPTENTRFYVFNVDDDRDPISYDDSVLNPFIESNNTVIFESGWLCILKAENGYVIVYQDEGGVWDTSSIIKYISLPNEMGVFGILNGRHSQNHPIFVSDGGTVEEDLSITECENIFINKYCTELDAQREDYGRLFVETVCDGYHNLFGLWQEHGYPNMECVVKRDIPRNGECFIPSENGIIESKFRRYRMFDNDEYEEDETFHEYDLEQELPNGDYLISSNLISSGKALNILKPNTTQPLSEIWFDKYMTYADGLYVVLKQDKIAYINEQGKQIGKWYDTYGFLDNNEGITIGVGAIGRGYQISEINILNSQEVFASFKRMVSHKAFNNKIVVLDNNGRTRCFDFIERKFCFGELTNMMKLSNYYHEGMYMCKLANTELKMLFDLKSERIVCSDIKDARQFVRYDHNLIKILKINNQYNIFDLRTNTELLPTDVDGIDSFNQYTQLIAYHLNNKYYIYSFANNIKQFVINPNGIPKEGIRVEIADSGYVNFTEPSYGIYFAPKNGKYVFYKWESNSDWRIHGSNLDTQQTPQEVINLYNTVVGASSVSENFKRILKRIDEASKLRLNNYIS